MVTEAQKRATAKWRKENVKTYLVTFYKDDMDLFEFLKEQENKTKYIRDLIRADMNKKKGIEE